MKKSRTITTTPAVTSESGMRLDKWLSESLPEFSRARLKTLILTGRTKIRGVTVSEPSTKIKPGDVAKLTVPPTISANPLGQQIPLDIVYEDNSIIVINKQAGMVVHPAAGNPDGTLVNALIAHCGESLSGIGGVRRPGIVHRLDKNTSGLMVAAKTDEAHRELSKGFKSRTIHRTYLALVWGNPAPQVGEISENIGRSQKNRKKMTVLISGGRKALTKYKVLETWGKQVSLVECVLDTGRTHQIRVHLAHRGHPVIGDPTYGRISPNRLETVPGPAKELIKGLKRQFLHAKALELPHPITGEDLRFETPLPIELKEILTRYSNMYKV